MIGLINPCHMMISLFHRLQMHGVTNACMSLSVTLFFIILLRCLKLTRCDDPLSLPWCGRIWFCFAAVCYVASGRALDFC